MWKQCSCCEYTKAALLWPLPWRQGGKMVSRYGLKDIQSLSVFAVDELQTWVFQYWKLSVRDPWLTLMKQTPLLWEQFGDRSILLFWALTSGSEETMTVLWWGVNSSTWCCFPLSPGIQHQQQSSCPQEVLTYPLPPSLPFPQSTPPPSPLPPLFDL